MEAFRDLVDGTVYFRVGSLVTQERDVALLWVAAERSQNVLLGRSERKPFSSPRKPRTRESQTNAQTTRQDDMQPLPPRSTFFLDASQRLSDCKIMNKRNSSSVSPLPFAYSTPGNAQGGHTKPSVDKAEDGCGVPERRKDIAAPFLADSTFDRFLFSLIEARERAGVEKISRHVVLHRRASSKNFRPRSQSNTDLQKKEEQR